MNILNKGAVKKYQQSDKGKVYIKKRDLKRNYNLSLEQVDEMLLKQDHKCAICSKSLIETKRCIDHDHKTGKVRGILCYSCNVGLEVFYDDPELMIKAIAYLDTFIQIPNQHQ